MRLAEAFRREAPNATLALHTLGAEFDFERACRGALETVIGNWPEPPDRMHLSMLLEDEIVCLVGARHPLAKREMTIEDYQRATHIVPMAYAPTQRGLIDATLATLRIQRTERVVVQSFTVAPYLLQGTDLVFTTTRHFANFYLPLLPRWRCCGRRSPSPDALLPAVARPQPPFGEPPLAAPAGTGGRALFLCGIAARRAEQPPAAPHQRSIGTRRTGTSAFVMTLCPPIRSIVRQSRCGREIP